MGSTWTKKEIEELLVEPEELEDMERKEAKAILKRLGFEQVESIKISSKARFSYDVIAKMGGKNT